MAWYSVSVTLDGDELRTYAIETDNDDAGDIALRALPLPDVDVQPLAERPVEFDPAFDRVIERGEA